MFLGTHQDNENDKTRKGRRPKGLGIYLNLELITKLWLEGYTFSKIEQIVGTDAKYLSKIMRSRGYKRRL